MAETARKSPRRWLWRALWAFGAVVSCVALAVGVGVVMLKGSYGATLVRDFADGRSAGGYGELELGSVRGDVLGRFRIDSLAIRDKNGVWLQADDIEISWSPLALTGRVLDLDQATAGRLDVLRRPERRGGPQRSSAGGGFDWSRWRLELGDAGVDRLALAEGVAGPAAVLSADASLSRDAGGWRGEVSAERLDAPGDHLNLRFEVNQDIQAQFELSAAPDGPLAEIFRASGSALSATGQVSGDRLSGSARASITVDGAEAGQVETGWSSGRVEASGRADLRLWPGLEGLAARVGGPVRFEAGAPFGEEGLTTLDIEGAVLDVRSGALTVTARPGSQGAVDVTADLGEGALALITGGQATAQAARLEGRFDPNGGGSVDGRLSAQEVTTPGGIVADSLQGRAAMAGPFSAPQLSWDVTTTGASLGVETLDAAIGPQAELRGVAVWRREAGQIAFSELSAALAAGTVSGSGGLELAARRYDFQLRSSALNLEALTDLVTGPGAVSAQVEGGFDGALQAQLDVDGFAPAGALQSRLSGPISGAASLQRGADGALRLDSVRLESPQARVEGAGRRDGRGWRFEGDAVWSGAAPVSALTLEGALTARFEADAGPEGVQARVEARAPALVVGPEPIDSPRLRLELAGPFEAVSGTARLTGQGGRGAIDLTARFARDGAGVSLPELTGQAGGFTVAGSASAGPGALSLSAGLTPQAGFGEVELDAALQGGRIQAQVRAQDLVFADLSYLDSAQATLEGPLDEAAFSLSAEGAYGAPFTVDADGQLALSGQSRALTLSLDGEYGVVPMATRAPMEIVVSPDLSVSADLSVGDGRAQLALRSGEAPRLSARLEDAPAALLSLRRAREPVAGRLSGDVELSKRADAWTGQAELRGDGLRPARASEDRALSGRLAARLTRERIEVSATASGADLNADARLSVETGAVTDPSTLGAGDPALEGSARLEGRIGAFAAFHLDPAQRLDGDVRAEADISGVLSDPVILGEARLSQGRFSDGRAGLDLRALSAQLDLTRTGARLTELTAEDGRGGTLSGQGVLDIADPLGVRADLTFEAFRLVDRDDLEAVATGDVRFVLDQGEGMVSGSAVIERADLSPSGGARSGFDQIEVTEINRPSGLDPAPRRNAGPPIALDYQVSAPRRVFVRGPNYDTEWGFELALSGTAADPVVMGEAQLVRGRADLLGRNFELETGEVILDGDPSRARINAVASTRRSEVTARVSVQGTVNDPEVSLSSDPALPEDEVASRILFGQSAANLTALQAAQLGAALASLSGGSGLDPLGALRDAAGLDTLGVRRDAAGDTVVAGGRYLTDDVFLQLESASTGAAPTTRIEWTLTPRFTLSSSLDGQGRAGLALSWRLEYDEDPFERLDLFAGFRDAMERVRGGDENSAGAPAGLSAARESSDAP